MSDDKEGIYLAFDPGVTTGFAKFKEDGTLIEFGQIQFPEILDFCHDLSEKYRIIRVIYEDYKIFGHKAKAHTGSRVPASQAIGVIKAAAMSRGIPLTHQPANILPIAEKWTQTFMPSNHAISHQVSAFLHGSYWLISNGIVKTQLQVQMAQLQDKGTSS